jgi:hypothetical protein
MISREEKSMSENRETNLVQLWIWNEEQSLNYWLEQTSRAKTDAPNDWRVKDGISKAERVAVYLLADALEDHHEDYAYDREPEASFLGDLIGLSLGRVDWYYIAEQLLDYEEG